MSLTRRGRVIFVGVAFLLGAVFELAVTGGKIDAPLDRLAIYYATAFPWATISTLLLQLFVIQAGELPPEWIEPIGIGVAGGIQGVLIGGLVLLLLLAFTWRPDLKQRGETRWTSRG